MQSKYQDYVAVSTVFTAYVIFEIEIIQCLKKVIF